MNINKFFEPNIYKIIFAIILLALIFLIPIIPALFEKDCIKAPCPSIIIMISGYRFIGGLYDITTIYTYLVILFEIIIAYALACLIWIKKK